MQNIKKYFMTLALLLTAVTGAWAQSTFGVVEFEVPADWKTDNTPLTAADLPGFKAVTLAEAQTWTGAPADGKAMLVYAFDGNTINIVNYDNGNGGGATTSNTKQNVFALKSLFKFYYTAEITEWPLTSQDGKTWTLAKMPANDIELQVEYFAESNLFFGKEALANKANISVLDGSTAVEFDAEGKSTTTVTEGNTVTAKFTGKKVLGMTVTKKEPIITWDNTNVFVEANQGERVDKWNTSATFEGITISFNGEGTASHFYPYDTMGADLDVLDYGDSFTFTAPTGKKFAKIEINGSFFNLNDANWSTQANGIVWSNTPSNTVTIATTESYSTDFDYITSIVFTLSE